MPILRRWRQGRLALHRANSSPCSPRNLPTRPSDLRPADDHRGPNKAADQCLPRRRRGDDADEPSNGTPVVRSVSDDDPSVHGHPRWGSTDGIDGQRVCGPAGAGSRSAGRWSRPAGGSGCERRPLSRRRAGTWLPGAPVPRQTPVRTFDEYRLPCDDPALFRVLTSSPRNISHIGRKTDRSC